MLVIYWFDADVFYLLLFFYAGVSCFMLHASCDKWFYCWQWVDCRQAHHETFIVAIRIRISIHDKSVLMNIENKDIPGFQCAPMCRHRKREIICLQIVYKPICIGHHFAVSERWGKKSTRMHSHGHTAIHTHPTLIRRIFNYSNFLFSSVHLWLSLCTDTTQRPFNRHTSKHSKIIIISFQRESFVFVELLENCSHKKYSGSEGTFRISSRIEQNKKTSRKIVIKLIEKQ